MALRTLAIRLVTALLVLVFAQPACFTMMTWRDDRVHPVQASAEAAAIEAFRIVDIDGAIAVKRNQALDAVIGEQAALPAEATWLVLWPEQYRSTVAVLLALAAVEQDPLDKGLELTLQQDEAGDCRWHLIYGVLGLTGDAAVRHLPGFHASVGMFTSSLFDVRLMAKPVTVAPNHLGERLHSIWFGHRLPFATSYRPLPRILWTPVAVAGDLISLPLELVWLLNR
jgi:hypothetical protein